jgi:hypothetical protein
MSRRAGLPLRASPIAIPTAYAGGKRVKMLVEAKRALSLADQEIVRWVQNSVGKLLNDDPILDSADKTLRAVRLAIGSINEELAPYTKEV